MRITRSSRALALRAAALAAAASLAQAFSPVLARFRDQHVDALHAAGRAVAAAMGGAVPDLFFGQTLDHFDVLNNVEGSKWQHRFWVNASFFTKPDAPVFLYIEGEGAGSPYSVMGGEHVVLAEQYGALIVALEHRFYGASIPTADMSTHSLRLLSSHQAIADIATFWAGYLVPTFKLTTANKLVSFGGSYPGALSAWARLRLPHIVHTAVSTSSPVEAQVDFVGYNEVVSSSLAYPLVGGSPACLANVAAAFVAMDAAFTGSDDARHAMASKLSSCTGLDAQNDTMWAASNYASIVMGVVQYNVDGSGLDIRSVCQQMTSAGQPIDNFALVVKTAQGGGCLDNAYADYLKVLNSTVADKSQGGLGLRQWTWQTCAEFAYYQSCVPGPSCPFSRLMTLESSYQQCQDGFGAVMSNRLNDEGVAFTNAYLGGNKIKGTRIIFVNGDVDPWHALSVFNQSEFDPYQPAVFIAGTAHCRNMYAPSANDPAPLVAARGEINGFLESFLAM